MDETAVRKKLCEMLGVSVNASETEIHKRYSDSVKEWHPDRVNHNRELAAIAEKRLKEINQIYECLTNQRQFEMYAEKLIKEASKQDASKSTASRANPQHAPAKETKARQANSGKTSTHTSAAENASQSSQAKPNQDPPSAPKRSSSLDAENAKIVTFIIVAVIVLWVLTNAGFFKPSAKPSYEPPSSSVVPNPADAPGAPVQTPASTYTDRTPPSNSVGPPP